jgi:uncharacterized protein (TIGR02646 family)
VIRLQRKGVKEPADWKKAVDAALPDPAGFHKHAQAFEKLAEQSATRKTGFSTYAPGVLLRNAKGEPDFPPVWRTDARVRVAIAGMSNGFCAYCQDTVSSSHAGKKGKKKPPGQVDHFRPKARFPSHAYKWNNYFLSCMACNNGKLDKWIPGGYVRPDTGTPGDRFLFDETGAISERKGDARARRTIEDFDLTRYWLTQHRGFAIQSHLDVIRRMLTRPGVRLDELLIKRPVAFSEAINQNVRRAWSTTKRKKRR